MRHLRYFLSLVLAGLFVLMLVASPATPVGGQSSTAAPTSGGGGLPTVAGKTAKQRVTFKSDNLTLVGYLFKPDGDGPFPAVIWNHGSEQDPGGGQEFDSIAQIFLPAGYVVFAPVRRGHEGSEGQYIADQVAATKKSKGQDAAAQLMVKLMETEQLDDQMAGLAYVKNLPYVDTDHLVVAGCSYGGIQTILGAERGGGYKAAIALSPGAESWMGNKYLQERLIKAVSGINIPVLIIHPQKDASLAPGYALGQEFQRLGKPYGLEIFPPFGTDQQQGHCFGGPKGFQIWAPDAIRFFRNMLHPQSN